MCRIRLRKTLRDLFPLTDHKRSSSDPLPHAASGIPASFARKSTRKTENTVIAGELVGRYPQESNFVYWQPSESVIVDSNEVDQGGNL